MGRFIDLSGQKFGKLRANKLAGKTRTNQLLWECTCDCGNTTVTQGAHLRSGNTTSCGCHKRSVLPNRTTTHGQANKTATYRSWKAMRNRCNNPNSKDYHNYGGRGIAVCERWDRYENFLSDMGEKPDGFSIERKDVNGDYTPENCTWIPHREQSRNKQKATTYLYDGEALSLSQLSERVGVKAGTLHWRIKRHGYKPEILKPKMQKGTHHEEV